MPRRRIEYPTTLRASSALRRHSHWIAFESLSANVLCRYSGLNLISATGSEVVVPATLPLVSPKLAIPSASAGSPAQIVNECDVPDGVPPEPLPRHSPRRSAVGDIQSRGRSIQLQRRGGSSEARAGPVRRHQRGVTLPSPLASSYLCCVVTRKKVSIRSLPLCNPGCPTYKPPSYPSYKS